MRNLTLEQVSQVETLYETKLDSKLLRQIKKKYPHLLEKPTNWRTQEDDE